MNTEKEKQSNNGNDSTTKNDFTRSSESKFSEEPQSSLNSSESGQQYEIVENTPFAVIKRENTWKIVIGNMIASPYDFVSKEAAEDYVEGKPWEMIWTMAVWLINNQEKFKLETEKK